MKKPNPEVGFQVADLTADGGFGEAQPPRGLGERLGFRGSDKGLESCETVHCSQTENRELSFTVIVPYLCRNNNTRRTGRVPAFKERIKPCLSSPSLPPSPSFPPSAGSKMRSHPLPNRCSG